MLKESNAPMGLPRAWDQQYPVNSAVFALWVQGGGICHWGSCGHLSDARRNER